MNIEEIDLRGITRRSENIFTKVFIAEEEWRRPNKLWITLGESQITHHDTLGYHQLQAYMTSGVTDFEHDSANALRLSLIGFKFDSVYYHTVSFTAWINPGDESDFMVPPPGYDPTKHKDAYQCEECTERGDPHMIVPEGFYCPPPNKELFNLVKGRRVEIVLGNVE